MQVLHGPDDWRGSGRKVSLAIGMFDGVHLGHQQVIRQAVADAEQGEGSAVVITFDKHPNAIVAPARVPPLIYSQPQKLNAIAALGADATLVIPFTAEFSAQPAQEFIRELAQKLSPLHSICVGSTFVFGHQRSGNVALLGELGRELGFRVHGIAAVSLDGQVVSSTRIREAVRAGDFDSASQMLGREYALGGVIVRGDGIGRRLGFPTANLDVTGMAVPPSGVYAVHAYVEGTRHRGVANIGHRPTLRDAVPQLRVEPHLLDFSGDLYGKHLELTFVAKLRDEQKFASVEALKEQIARDVAEARERF
jgi:riboflavin kinase / FMN adenylyltransferase